MLEALRRRLSRRNAGEPIVVVSGLPRSGTSMMMRMLEAGGVPILSDGAREADIDNPKGYYELERIKHLEKETDKSYLREGRGKAVKAISFLIKDLPDENDYRVIFMRRDLDEVLDRVDLYAFGDHEVGSLSAGQKRRLALARLLATEARLWILDEPFTSLDRSAMARFSDVFQAHLEQGGIVVVTSHHDIELPARPVQRLDLGRAA